MGGRGIGKYQKGDRIAGFEELEAGMLLASYSRQFDALNLIQVVEFDQTGLERDIFYWGYAEVDGPTAGRCAARMGAMWSFEFGDAAGALGYDLYRVHLGESEVAN